MKHLKPPKDASETCSKRIQSDENQHHKLHGVGILCCGNGSALCLIRLNELFRFVNPSTWLLRVSSDPRGESLVEKSQVVLVQRLADHPVDLLLHARRFVGIGIAAFELHSNTTPHRDSISVPLLLLLV